MSGTTSTPLEFAEGAPAPSLAPPLRALVSRPRLLALDEPLGALDALTRIEMQRLIETVWLLERFTAILVTHDVGEAVALADRIALIESGALALDIEVDLPRPRRRGSIAAAKLETEILARLLGEAGAAASIDDPLTSPQQERTTS